MNIVDNYFKREQTILAIINETTNSDYKANIWPKIMSISRIPELVDQVLLSNENERLLLAIEKLQCRFELQPHRFRIYQLLPISKICIICQGILGEPKFDEICNIIGRNDIYNGVLYKNECCDMIYKYGYIRNRRTRERLLIPDAIFKQEFIHLFDRLIYERSLLVAFTNLLHGAASNFLSYTNATNADIDQNRNFNNQLPIKNKIHSKYFAATWIWFEICRYLFFMTNFHTIQIPDIIQRLSHNMYFEANASFFYETFIKFWSRHGQIEGCQCRAKDTCMLNFVFDTHMKAHRLVCAYTSSCDESVPEMGPVAVGCPRPPLRSTSSLLKNMSTINKNKCKHYCADHYKYGLEPNIIENSTTTKANELERNSDEFEDTDECTVHRDEDDTQYKRRTAGFMAIVSNCNVIIGWNESIRSEGMRRNAYHLLKYLHLGGILPQAVAYDSACTFLAYLKNQYCVSIMPSPYVDELLQKKYCIDRFHRRNHTRPECKTVLSCSHPDNRPFFDGQNTQVCEQLFAHFTKLKAALRSITWPYSNIFYCLIFHLRNCSETQIFPDNPYLAVKSNIPPPTSSLFEWTHIMASHNYQLQQQNQGDCRREDDDIEETYNEYE
ncbi:unnamed protein product [Adineta steineri]|uniref:Uncharacterized protein n=1 Tax=Adineta steineri TaxID=433720 RepID=A0A819IQD4_9BILA|nr:unnamed protein product [Adineta steineri]CAF3921005.1 unnamed protein product [Adineta steineri]